MSLNDRSCYVRFICPAARNMKDQSCRKRWFELSTLSSPSLLQATRKKTKKTTAVLEIIQQIKPDPVFVFDGTQVPRTQSDPCQA